MKKVTNWGSLLGMLLSFMVASAQNTAIATGNWNNCATWGYPAGITKGNDASSTKTISNDVTVIMNTNWNVQNVSFGSNGALDFASSSNVLDLNVPGGTSQVCEAQHFALGSATSNQTMNAGTDLSFTNLANNVASISGTSINLKAGHVYKLTSQVYMTGTVQSNAYFDYQWVNSSNVALPVSVMGRAVFENGFFPDAMQTGAVAVYKPTADVTVKVRVVGNGGTGTSVASRTYALVEEINSASQYNFSTASGTQYLPANTDLSFAASAVNSGIANATGVNFPLTAGKTYRLQGSTWVSLAQAGSIAWVNASNVALPGQVNRTNSQATAVGEFPNPTAISYYTPTANGNVKMRVTSGAPTGYSVAGRTYAAIEEIPSGANYLMAIPSASQTLSNNLDLNFGTTIVSSGITLSGGNSVNLLANHTYILHGVLSTANQTASGGYVDYQWVNASNSAIPNGVIGRTIPFSTTTFSDWAQSSAVVIYKPTVNTTVKLRTIGFGGTTGTSEPYGFIYVKELN
ncbi:hypothetical protein [uncultured Flavobacterium sp.]|uniref:hypothetical protein n=1 Tax=uncultured Flavobacterium sp. TaxID=165435 RepID=UPI0025FD19FD|nr:hypothetical protein [uncultured Flavobacterium sp.]